MVNTGQQVGGSIGTALLNTLAATATTGYLAAHLPTDARTAAAAAVHGYSTAYSWGAGFFLLGAVLAVTLFRTKADTRARAEAAAADQAERAGDADAGSSAPEPAPVVAR